jgi:single-strand DNA-binding protein
MLSLNRVQLTGFQTQLLALRTTPTGTSVTNLNLLTPYTYRTSSGEETIGRSFHTVTLWGQLAEFASQFIREGSHIYISGRLQTDSWEDKESKEMRSRTKVVAQELILLEPKSGPIVAAGLPGNLTACLNRADIIGNVTKEPEVRTTVSGQSVLTLGVATNMRWKSKATGESQERTEFHNAVFWGSLTELVSKHVKKGQRVHVTGRVQTRSWQTPQGGKRATTEIVAESISLLGLRMDERLTHLSEELSPITEIAPAKDPSEEPVSPELSYEPSVKAEDLPF